MKNFEYLLDKISESKIIETPFPHIYIENFFSKEDFSSIVNSDGINTKNFKNNDELFKSLFELGYKIIDFPGCINNIQEYSNWQLHKNSSKKLNTACEGFGMTLRLMQPNSEILGNLKSFIESQMFNIAIAEKFGIDIEAVYSDNGLQKYLDGYEISPHPDIRKKALTYMININPHSDSETLEHHTHYLQLKSKYKYIQEFWKSNTQYDRCWIPWDWAETAFLQNKNNSLVMFSPSDETIHAVKASYNHLSSQRTQLYGNLWFNESAEMQQLTWEDLMIAPQKNEKLHTNTNRLKDRVPQRLKNFIKGFYSSKTQVNYSSIRNQKNK